MPIQFLGREISVTLGEGEARLPTAFRLGKESHAVKEVIASWREEAFAGRPPGRDRRWQSGQLRQFYRLRTKKGEVFEIYVDAPAVGRHRAEKARWYVLRRITGPPAAPEAPAEPAPAPRPAPARKAPARRKPSAG